MKNLVMCIITGFSGLVTMTSTIHAQDSLGRIRVSAPFPDVELPALVDGKRANLKSFRGKPTVLIVFASW